MNILSFHYTIGAHESCAALLRNGSIVAAAEEERFSRKKHDGGIPLRAVEYCLDAGGLDMREIDVVAIPTKPFRTGFDAPHRDVTMASMKKLHAAGVLRRRMLLHRGLLDVTARSHIPPNLLMDPTVAAGIDAVRRRFGKLPRLRYYDHHLCHAATAYYTSGFERTPVLTVDGRGIMVASALWKAGESGIERIADEPYINSLGLFYQDCTLYAGLGEFGYGKLMGLASYGDPGTFRQALSEVLQVRDGSYHYVRGSLTPGTVGFPPRTSESPLDPPYPDFAAAVQEALERAILELARRVSVEGGNDSLCIGGGVALNCAANGKLAESGEFGKVWIFPSAGDAGLALGATFLAAREFGEPRIPRVDSAYWGPGFDEGRCAAAFDAAGIRFERHPDIAEAAAERLAAGHVIGWFQGRMEIGPRALGNRSILADPRSVEIRDRVNRIKAREHWRPLAPVVTVEDAPDFFEMSGESPFMLLGVKVRNDARERIAGTVHVDGSARPQTVHRDQHPRLHTLLKAFEVRTGVPVLINTSFNHASEPIVCSPEDAIRTFLTTDLDALVLGDLIADRAGR